MLLLEICEEGILYYSTSSHIVSNSSVMIPVTDSVLGYDRNNRKLLYYNDVNDNLYSSSLNGADIAVLLSNDKIMYFAYDGKRGVLYYLNRLTSDIHSVNISSGQDQLIQALSSLSDIKDLEVDIKNEYVSHSPLFQYFLKMMDLNTYIGIHCRYKLLVVLYLVAGIV